MKEKAAKTKEYILPVAAVIVAVIAAVVIVTRTGKSNNSESTGIISAETNTITISDGKIRVLSDSLSDSIKFIDYESNGTPMQIMLLKTSDGTVRSAFNTCQQCSGSPYAFFIQSGENIICQNCGNHFALEQIGIDAYGCNPIPVEHMEDNGEIIVKTEELDKYAPAFANWKKGV